MPPKLRCLGCADFAYWKISCDQAPNAKRRKRTSGIRDFSFDVPMSYEPGPKILLVASVLRQYLSFVTSPGEWCGSAMLAGKRISNKINFLSPCLGTRVLATQSEIKCLSCYGCIRPNHTAAEHRPVFQSTLKPKLSTFGQSMLHNPKAWRKPLLTFCGKFHARANPWATSARHSGAFSMVWINMP